MEISKVSVTRNEGCYDLAHPKDMSACISVRFEIDGTRYLISDNVEIGSKYDYDGDDISDAVDHIDNALKRYWIHSGREKTQKAIALFWENEALIRRAYAKSQASRYQRLAAHNASLARRYLDEAMAEIEADELPSAA